MSKTIPILFTLLVLTGCQSTVQTPAPSPTLPNATVIPQKQALFMAASPLFVVTNGWVHFNYPMTNVTATSWIYDPDNLTTNVFNAAYSGSTNWSILVTGISTNDWPDCSVQVQMQNGAAKSPLSELRYVTFLETNRIYSLLVNSNTVWTTNLPPATPFEINHLPVAFIRATNNYAQISPDLLHWTNWLKLAGTGKVILAMTLAVEGIP